VLKSELNGKKVEQNHSNNNESFLPMLTFF